MMEKGKKHGRTDYAEGLLETLRTQMMKRFHDPAIMCEDHVLTWGDFWERSNRLANAYTRLGLVKGDRMQVLLPNCIEYPEVFLGGNKAGLINAAGNYHLTGRELAYQLNNCGARALVVKSSQQYKNIQAIREQLPLLEHVIMVENNTPQGALSYQNLLFESSPEEPLINLLPDDIYLLMYTSGTTGLPKGVIRTFGTAYYGPLAISHELGLTPGDVFLAAAPMSAAATMVSIFTALFAGGAVGIVPAFDASTVLDYVEKYRATWTYMVPIMYEWILNQPPEVLNKPDISSLRYVLAVGAPLHNRTAARMMDFFKGVEIDNWLGASELGYVTRHRYNIRGIKEEGCVGRPFFDVELKILDDDKKPVKQGESGILYARSRTTLAGYFNNEEATRAAYFDKEWVTVGDIARQDEEGDFFIVDRKIDMIISGGINIYPAEVEQVIQKIEGVEDNVVIGVPDEKWGESVKALVVKNPGSNLTDEGIIAACRKDLAGFKVPKSVDFVPQIPRSPVGKALKKDLRKKYWEGRESSI
jgi:long-chain acyl-CoA synthetase